jgi:3-deoxy-D-manno-octulosonate 8-phosphate phosphatase (KDO 8-P phosphatase)
MVRTIPRALDAKLRRIRMVLFDVDGVLTDGGLYYSGDGVEMKRFHAHDGYGVVRAHRHGLKVGLISGRTTPIVNARAAALSIDDVIQGTEDKLAAMHTLQQKYGFADEEFAFVGDELFDIPLLQAVGFSGAPQNARKEVKNVVDYVTTVEGGNGVAREIIDLILSAQRRWTTKAG